MNGSTAVDPNDHVPDWLSTKEAAQLLDVRVRDLYQLIDEGRLPGYKMGRVIRLRRREVLAYLAGEFQDPDEGPPDG